jgi:hypothetical protein
MTDDKLLGIYLSDHLAGSTSGVNLAKRSIGRNEGNRYARELGEICDEIEEDIEVAHSIARRLGVQPSRIKRGIAWLGERAGRLKLNGRVAGYSPLSRLIEVEGLTMGVTGKLQLWRSLQAGPSDDPRLRDVDLNQLVHRAERQRQRLEQMHQDAAHDALLTHPPSET